MPLLSTQDVYKRQRLFHAASNSCSLAALTKASISFFMVHPPLAAKSGFSKKMCIRDRVKNAVHAYAAKWVEQGLVPAEFLAYVQDETKITFCLLYTSWHSLENEEDLPE